MAPSSAPVTAAVGGPTRAPRGYDGGRPRVLPLPDAAARRARPLPPDDPAGAATDGAPVAKPAACLAAEPQAAGDRRRSEAVRLDAAARLPAPRRPGVRLGGIGAPPRRGTAPAVGADAVCPLSGGDAAGEALAVGDLDDLHRLAARLEGVARVAVLGAGPLGCEVANALLLRGIAPTVIDPAEAPLAQLLPAQAGCRLRFRLEDAGASFLCGTAATRVDRRAAGGARVTLDDGTTLDTDLVLSTLGPRPCVAAPCGAGPVAGAGADRRSAACPATPVVVRTPAWPTLVCPPPPDLAGDWEVTHRDESVEARFLDTAGVLRGYALMGAAVAGQAAWAARMPALRSAA